MNRTQADDPIVASLAKMHTVVNARHTQARAVLLASLPDEMIEFDYGPKPSATSRFVLGGLGVAAVASAVALTLWAFAATSPAVAMEKLAKALDQVNGYTYRMEETSVSRKGEGRTVRQVTVGRWRTAPAALYATMQIVETLRTNAAAPTTPKTLVDLEEAHQANQGGIVIDHLKKEYWQVHEEIDANSIPSGSPQVAVHMVRQRRGRVLRDLGEKKISDQVVRGLEIVLDDSRPESELGPNTAEGKAGRSEDWIWRQLKFEVWINPTTDLPVEFRCTRRGDDFETTYLFTDLNWNVEFDAAAFDAVAPDGYTQRDTAPFTEKD
jgi:hypothetical protein